MARRRQEQRRSKLLRRQQLSRRLGYSTSSSISSCWWVVLLLFVGCILAATAAAALEYREYPLRTQEEAAVIEWGHSAIISALDVSVAHFGPQTSQAALFEVETMPILADPLTGFMVESERADQDNEQQGQESSSKKTPKITPLLNAEAVKGNMVVMTNAGHFLSGVQMAQIAQLSGAAALLIVNIDEEHTDEIYRLEVQDQAEQEVAATIDIPVVMMSYNSASVLTTATITQEMKPEDIVNHGMPERIRLYAGGDRPFFEDVVTGDPAVYLIHNLLNKDECESLVQQAANKMQPIIHNHDDSLQLLQHSTHYQQTSRVMLWQGMLQSQARKMIEERIEQATGFPADHFSDFVIDRLDKGARWEPFLDTLEAAPGGLPMATLTIFLTQPASDKSGGDLVYPQASGGRVAIRPQIGLSVTHHNMNERHEFEPTSLHGLLEYTGDEPLYIARKYVFAEPVSNARRIALPVFAAPMGGRLPAALSALYDLFAQQFGHETGGKYFDKLCVFVPMLILLSLVQWIVNIVRAQLAGSGSSSNSNTSSSSNSTSTKKESKQKEEPSSKKRGKRGKAD